MSTPEIMSGFLIFFHYLIADYYSTVICVTHDMMEALRFAARMCALGAGGFRKIAHRFLAG
jgi:ABC-type proline/glycine betaine transport system ATPase subunit